MSNIIRFVIGAIAYAMVLVTVSSQASVSGETVLPTSEHEAESEFKVMNPNAHEDTIAAAREQCNREADRFPNDRLTLKHCVSFEQQLTNGDCPGVIVRDKDKIVHDIVAVANSKPLIRARKKTGRDDQAVLCDVGDEVHIYWYMMSREDSCNNIAPTFAAKPAVAEIDVVQHPAVAGKSTMTEINAVQHHAVMVDVCLPGQSSHNTVGGPEQRSVHGGKKLGHSELMGGVRTENYRSGFEVYITRQGPCTLVPVIISTEAGHNKRSKQP